MKKIVSLVLAMVLVLSSMSALAAGVAPVVGDSPIKATATVVARTIKVSFIETPLDAEDDVAYLFYKPESEISDNILEENVIHSDLINYNPGGFSFTISSELPAGVYNLLIGGPEVDIPCLLKIELGEAVKKGDLNEDTQVTVSDLTRVARYLAAFETDIDYFEENPSLAIAADVNQDGRVTVADMVKLARYLAGFGGVDLNDDN